MKINQLLFSLLFLVFSSSGLFAQDMSTENPKKKAPSAETDLIGEWTHAREQDTSTDYIFRSSKFRLPATRGGRDKVVLNKDNTVLDTSIGPDDKPVEVSGIWKMTKDGNVEVVLGDYRRTTYILYTDELRDGILKKRKESSAN